MFSFWGLVLVGPEKGRARIDVGYLGGDMI